MENLTFTQYFYSVYFAINWSVIWIP